MDSDTLVKLLEWAWVGLGGMVAYLWRKVTGMETRTVLLEAQAEHAEKQRIEDRQARNETKRDIIERIDFHHAAVVSRIDRIEKEIKNGHGSN